MCVTHWGANNLTRFDWYLHRHGKCANSLWVPRLKIVIHIGMFCTVCQCQGLLLDFEQCFQWVQQLFPGKNHGGILRWFKKLRMEYSSLILKNGSFFGEFFLKNGTRGSGLMAAWWYALMELTSVMLPLWCFGCHVDFFLDVDLRSGGGMHLKDVVFFGDFFRDCLRVFFFGESVFFKTFTAHLSVNLPIVWVEVLV